MTTVDRTAEGGRLHACYREGAPWLRWGPYLAERQWGTVREDYSHDGDAWSYFSHDQARSRAYRWGEDGIAGVSDEKQRLCLALALWNDRDPILKERLFGLTNAEGNHGEDVKEYYFYLDSTPTHSYMRYLYKYPQAAFPYDDLVATNRARSRTDFEYELLDTGVFDDDRYFDVFVEYAKADTDDLLVRITAENRGPDAAPLHLLPTLWFRNTWSWGDPGARPSLRRHDGPTGVTTVAIDHPDVAVRFLSIDGDVPLLFTENETNAERVFGAANASPYVKDAFHAAVVEGRADAVNPAQTGTKAAPHIEVEVAAGGQAEVRLRLGAGDPATRAPFGPDFEATFTARRAEADDFYAAITPPALSADEAHVMRQALAGMLWSKQYYLFDVDRWLDEHGANPFGQGGRTDVRNRDWFHMVNDDIISMPDTWEYPWYAAWDLAFHTLALGLVDPDFAHAQLELMLRDVYLHPSGQIPAYEWNFGDVNPPVHAWATLYVDRVSGEGGEQERAEFLKSAFHKLMLNFTWWVNRKDIGGRSVFQGGFLGMDNIGVFDRSSPLPTGGYLEQADGTAWMAFFALNMVEMALDIAETDPTYVDLAVKFAQHFFLIAASMDLVGDRADELWDEEDGFFYDVVRLPDGEARRLKVRSLVGLLPLCATTVFPASVVERYPDAMGRIRSFLSRHPELAANLPDPARPGVSGRRLLAIVDERKLRRILSRMLDEAEFLSPHGIRSLSRAHLDDPFELDIHGEAYRVAYEAAESSAGMFGGNSNWRGPVWYPVNALLVRALFQFHLYYGDDFRVECPTGSGVEMTLFEVAQELMRRLTSIYALDADGRRPVFGGSERFQSDPLWRDNILFFEYHNGDDGAGLGASHQTGWTGMVARFLQLSAFVRAEDLVGGGTRILARSYRGEPEGDEGAEGAGAT
jgi:hypothetical protein